jgi:hypothetical protein
VTFISTPRGSASAVAIYQLTSGALPACDLPDFGLILPKFATSVEGPPPPPRPAPPAATGPEPAPFSGASYPLAQFIRYLWNIPSHLYRDHPLPEPNPFP